MTVRAPFQGNRGRVLLLVASAASAAVTGLNETSKSVRITNAGSSLVFVRLGVEPLTASTADTPVLPGTSIILTRDHSERAVAVIAPIAPTSDVYIQLGEGGI